MEKLLDRVLFVVIAFSMVLASPAHATDFCKNPIGRRLFSKVCAKQASGGDSSAPTDVGGAKGGPAVEANTTVISHSEDAVGALRAAYSNHRGELVTINTAFDDAAIQRELRVYFPKTPPPEKGYAVILAFHGRGQTAEYASRYMGLTDTTNNLAEAGAFIVIYPQGWEYELAAPPESNSSRLGRRRSPQRLAETQTTDGGRQNRVSGWAVMPGAANPVNDFAFVDTILKSLTQVENLRIDPKRIGATGFSNGAIFTESLICTDARISAAAVVAGNLALTTDTCTRDKPFSYMHVHGKNDRHVAYGGGTIAVTATASLSFAPVETTIENWRNFLHCQTEPTLSTKQKVPARLELLRGGDQGIDHNVYSGCDGGTRVESFITGDGHVFPRGSTTEVKEGIRWASGLDVAPEIVRFFAEAFSSQQAAGL